MKKKQRLEVVLDKESGEISVSSCEFPVELHDAIKAECQKYYDKYYG